MVPPGFEPDDDLPEPLELFQVYLSARKRASERARERESESARERERRTHVWQYADAGGGGASSTVV
jgi:hypothetical protein